MALRPLQFEIPRREPSVIEDAFRTALATGLSSLIQEPFARRTAEREQKFQVSLQERLAKLRERLASVELTPGREATLRTAGVDPETVSQTLDGGRFVGREILAGAQQATRPISGEEQSLLDRVVGIAKVRLPARRGAPIIVGAGPEGGIDVVGETPPFPLSRQVAERVRESLPLALRAAEVEEEQARTRLQRESQRDIQIARMLAASVVGLQRYGNLVSTEGPLELSDIGLLENYQALALLAQKDKGVQPLLERANEFRRRIQAGEFKPIVATAKALNEYVASLSAPGQEASIALQGIGVSLDKMGLMYKQDRPGAEPRRITEKEEAALHIASNPDLLQAVAALRLGFQNMDDVVQAEKTPEGVRLPPGALSYLQIFFYKNGIPNWKYPGRHIGLPEGIPATSIPPQMRIGLAGGATAAPPAPAGGGSLLQTSPGGGTVLDATAAAGAGGGPSRTVPQVELVGNSVYRSVYEASYRNLSTDVSKFQQVYDSLNSAHTSPESAAKFYRSRGQADLATRLERGDRVLLTLLKTNALNGLRDARNRVLADNR